MNDSSVNNSAQGEATGEEQSIESLEEELESLQTEVSRLKQDLDEKESLSEKYLNTARRIQAEFENYKKRMKKEKERMVERANQEIISDFLDILDDFERALESECSQEEFREGIHGVKSNLQKLLKSYGLKEIPCDCRFNPEYHEALSVVEGENGQISKVFQRGYFLGDDVLRCAKVEVERKSKGDDQDGKNDRNRSGNE